MATTGEAWAAIIAPSMPRTTAQRVRAGRRLRQIGAVAVRPGVYALPDSTGARDALSAAAREVGRQRGAVLRCVVSWLDPDDAEELHTRFERARARRRETLLRHIAALERAIAGGAALGAARRRTANARLARMRRRLDLALPAAAAARDPSAAELPGPIPSEGAALRGRVWVTRKGVLVDRIASAWLIARFVDHAARFRFVTHGEPTPAGAVRFDMPDAEYGHEGDRCTFETLVRRLRGDDPALRQLGEIVHDLDLRDGRYRRPEAPGVALAITGLARNEPDDAERLRQGQWLFDTLYAALRPGAPPRPPKGVLP